MAAAWVGKEVFTEPTSICVCNASEPFSSTPRSINPSRNKAKKAQPHTPRIRKATKPCHRRNFIVSLRQSFDWKRSQERLKKNTAVHTEGVQSPAMA